MIDPVVGMTSRLRNDLIQRGCVPQLFNTERSDTLSMVLSAVEILKLKTRYVCICSEL